MNLPVFASCTSAPKSHPQSRIESLLRKLLNPLAWNDYQPGNLSEIVEGMRDRVQVQNKMGFRVEIAVLNAAESRKAFKTSLALRGIQPVWVKIFNTTDSPVWFLPLFLDQEYFAPL